MTTPTLHPDLAPIAGLLGTWEGDGAGEYPTIDPFTYTERVTFGHGGKPFLAYSQRTQATDDHRPLHVETGYWRAVAIDRVELVLAHPTGITELAEGSIRRDGDVVVIDVASTFVGLSSTAKSVTAVERTFRLDGDVLDYTVRMGAVGQPLQHHLAASLRRIDAP